MTDMLELDVTDIQIIAEKNEEANFRFFNRKRSRDGFVLMTEGSGFVTDSQGNRYEFLAGDVMITAKGDSYTVEAENPCSYITSAFALETDKSLLPFVHRCTKQQYNELLEICRLWQLRSWESFAVCRIGIMKFYLELIKKQRRTGNVDSDIAKAMDFIHKNFKTNFSGKEISDYCCVSLSYLRAKFLRQTGSTIGKYRDALRVAAAKEMLQSRYFTVTEIAAELGYCDVYHFSKTFSACTGVSPTKWSQKK